MRCRFYRQGFWLIYILILIVLVEGGSFVILSFLDNRLGNSSERHLYNPISIFKNYFSSDGLDYAYDQIELGQYYNLYR